jgi:hypothetical protein
MLQSRCVINHSMSDDAFPIQAHILPQLPTHPPADWKTIAGAQGGEAALAGTLHE